MGRRSASSAELTLEERQVIGARVDEMARKAGSRAKAAEYAGVTVQQLGRIIAGTSTPSGISLARLAAKTGFSLDWLFEVTPDAAPQRALVGAMADTARNVQEFGRFAIRIHEVLKAKHPNGEAPPLDEVAGAFAELIFDARAGSDDAELLEVVGALYEDVLAALKKTK